MSDYNDRVRSIFLHPFVVWCGTVSSAATFGETAADTISTVRVIAVQRYVRSVGRTLSTEDIVNSPVSRCNPSRMYRPDLISEKQVSDVLGEPSWQKLERTDLLHIHAVEALAMELVGAAPRDEFEAESEHEEAAFAHIQRQLDLKKSRLYESEAFAALRESDQWQIFVEAESIEPDDGYCDNDYEDSEYHMDRLLEKAEEIVEGYSKAPTSSPETVADVASNIWDRLGDES